MRYEYNKAYKKILENEQFQYKTMKQVEKDADKLVEYTGAHDNLINRGNTRDNIFYGDKDMNGSCRVISRQKSILNVLNRLWNIL